MKVHQADLGWEPSKLRNWNFERQESVHLEPTSKPERKQGTLESWEPAKLGTRHRGNHKERLYNVGKLKPQHSEN